MAKTRFEIKSIFDGELDATDVFVSLIMEKLNITKTQEKLCKSEQDCYTKDEVHIFNNLASGLCG